VSMNTLYAAARYGRLESFRLSGRLYCRVADVERYKAKLARAKDQNTRLASLFQERWEAFVVLEEPSETTLSAEQACGLLGLTQKEVNGIFKRAGRERLSPEDIVSGLGTLKPKAHERTSPRFLLVLSISEASRRLEITRRSIQDAVDKGLFAAAVASRSTYVLTKELDRWWRRERVAREERKKKADLVKKWTSEDA
ncbi:MAG: hypothetical protein AAFX94_14930, partial [Myxococcota bacterium]